MLDHAEKIINAQKRIVNIQYNVLIVLGFIIFDLIIKMESVADLLPVQLRQFKRWIATKGTQSNAFELVATVSQPGQPI